MVAFTSILLAAAGVLGLVESSPMPLGTRVTYKNYRGDGTIAKGWPSVSDWTDFETL